jgi:pimeloyl-ACP methyl ester carboxylesterase
MSRNGRSARRQERWRRVHVALLVAVAVNGLDVMCSAASASAVTCTTTTVNIAVGLVPQTISGTYCRPRSRPSQTVFVLVPGATYNHLYWAFPYKPQTYDFARAMAVAGFAAYAIDRLGTGDSSRPPSATLTGITQGVAVHQVIGYLRRTGFGAHRFKTVLLGGHSLGSAISIIEAATFKDVDGVLLTGIGHHVNLVGAAKFLAFGLGPAFLQSRFAGYDPGYLTTLSGTRDVFYAPGLAEAEVLQTDEATKDVFASTEAPDGLGLGTHSPYSALINAPVLLVNGSLDQLICGGVGSHCGSGTALLAQERPYYSGAPCVDAFVMPGIGHDVNLAPTAPTYRARVITWARSVIAGNCPGTPSHRVKLHRRPAFGRK